MGLKGQNTIEISNPQPSATGSVAPSSVLRLVGRIGLTQQADNPWAEPGSPGGARQFSASFELEGHESEGQMRLFSPIGSQLALLSWSATGAVLEASGAAARRFESLDAMLQELTGARIPALALFGWLRGVPSSIDGWSVDLSRYSAPTGAQSGTLAGSGRISAQRSLPKPATALTLVLE
jgi:outer membrane lipoprotein LolB